MNAGNVISGAGFRLRRGESSARRWTPAELSSLAPCGLAAIAVFAGTWVSFRLGQTLASIAFFYLVCVVLTAVYGGFWQATCVSVISVACLDFFFEDPIFSFTVGRVSNWIELAAFEFTALVISQLSNRAHLRELEAIAERRDTERLYQTARRILLFDAAHGDPGPDIAALIREVFDLDGVALFDAGSGKTYHAHRGPGTDMARLEEQCRAAYVLDANQFEPRLRDKSCTLRLGARPVGGLALRGGTVKELTADAIASLAAIALERSRTLEKQYHAEAARQAEQLRTAVLDSLAHQFKTPLTVIRTASSGLPAAGELSPLQTELVSLIDQEAQKLSGLASRLAGAPKLDSAAFAPQPEPVLLSRLMKSAIQEIEKSADRARFQIVLPPNEAPIFADRELILTALSQLVDNALKYSASGSPINISIDTKETGVVLHIRSRGLVVAPGDRERIFERFYRAPGAQSFTSGTGLGLSIVKTIVTDHGGRVWANGEPEFGTVFSLFLPSKFGAPDDE